MDILKPILAGAEIEEGASSGLDCPHHSIHSCSAAWERALGLSWESQRLWEFLGHHKKERILCKSRTARDLSEQMKVAEDAESAWQCFE